MGRVTILLAALASVAAAAPAAHGDELVFATDRPVSNTRTITAISAATQLLPDAPCHPRFFIADLPADYAGYAVTVPGVCVGWLTDRVAVGGRGYRGWQGRVFACTVIEHEALHELGYVPAAAFVAGDGGIDETHSADAASIMWPFTRVTVSWPCFARFAPRGGMRIWRRDYPGTPWAAFP